MTLNSPAKRAKVGIVTDQIIKHRRLPRDFAVEIAVRGLYLEIWDGFQAET